MFNKDLYPTVETFKYPKRERRILVSLHIYDAAKATKEINLNDFYIARMEWTNDANVLSAQVLNRHQDNLVCFYRWNGNVKNSFE
jgi:dipeptidyl-peptidase-4